VAQGLQPGSILAMSEQAADRLLKQDSGDAALLYLHLLRRGGAQGLTWSEKRLCAAMEQLQSLGLAPQNWDAPPSTAAPAQQEALPPEYTTGDITQALADSQSTFPALCDEVERRLGKRLSTADLKNLYTLYDHLALPAEVILLLVGWCMEKTRQKYGPGRKPFTSQIRKEGFLWAQRGVDTIQRAEEHIAYLMRRHSREGELLQLLDIPPRPLVERERSYLAAWDEMGFEDGAIRLAYEKTVLKKQAMNWNYMNAILRGWHEKGLHTVQAIQSGDRGAPGRPAHAGPERGADSAREELARMRRLMEQMKKEGGSHGV